jgi:endonuclease/exonuclease/phosphatase family metal-dependent hydrolase/8-oxo-dGTP pyrophosphatase MutT (NUDIX family)
MFTGNASNDDRLTVVTYNLLNGEARAGTRWAWAHRREAVVRAVRFCQPDLLGVQEAFGYQVEELAAALPGHDWVARGREADGNGETAAVFYRRDRFTRVAEGHFWLSETPDNPGSRSWGSHCTRVATWVRLRAAGGDGELVFANTHLDHGSEAARVAGAGLLARRLTALAGSTPLVLTGDFNAAGEGSEAWSVLFDEGLVDAWVAAPVTVGPTQTWCDFGPPDYAGGERIDWVLSRGPVVPCWCETVAYREAAGFPSDHLPVRAQFALSRAGAPAASTVAPVCRRSAARALLITPAGEVLLMCAQDPADGRTVWFAPGGGLEPGETDADALQRELAEETGQRGLPLGPQVWRRFHAFPWGNQRLHQHERFYLVPTPRFVPSMQASAGDSEQSSFRAYRWWTPAEIEASPEVFAPRRLPELLRQLQAEGPPEAPIDSGV